MLRKTALLLAASVLAAQGTDTVFAGSRNLLQKSKSTKSTKTSKTSKSSGKTGKNAPAPTAKAGKGVAAPTPLPPTAKAGKGVVAPTPLPPTPKAGKTGKGETAVASNAPAGYIRLDGINIPGNNDVVMTSTSIEACAAKCNTMGAQCQSFDWKEEPKSCSLTKVVSPKSPYQGGALFLKEGSDYSVADNGELCGPRTAGVPCVGGLTCMSGFGDDGSFSICVDEEAVTSMEKQAASGEQKPPPGIPLGEACQLGATTEATKCMLGLDCEGGYGPNKDLAICVAPTPDGFDVKKNMVIVTPANAEVLDEVVQPHMCAFFCLTKGPNCVSFNYFKEEQTCVLSVEDGTKPGALKASTTGSFYYKLDLVSQFGEPCGGPIKCMENFVCTDGFGDTGTWWMCAWPVPAGYQVLRSHNIPGNNMETIEITQPGVQECADACDKNPKCVSFDYKAQEDTCALSQASTGWETYPGDLFFKVSALNAGGR